MDERGGRVAGVRNAAPGAGRAARRYSYLGPHTDRHMKEYFTLEQTVEFLRRCQRAGITAHQFSTPDRRAEGLRVAREQGVTMHFICLHSQREKLKTDAQRTQPIAMVHHGGVTDRLYAEGKFTQVHDFVKAAHDAGVLAGVSAHNPDSIKRVADDGWEDEGLVRGETANPQAVYERVTLEFPQVGPRRKNPVRCLAS